MRNRKLSFEELVKRNKEEIKKNPDAIKKIDDKIENKFVKQIRN